MIFLCSLSVILELAWQAESPFTLNYMEKCIQDILQKYAFCIPLKKNECGFGMTYGGINDEGTLILCANYGYVNINKLKHLRIHKTPLTCTFLVRFFSAPFHYCENRLKGAQYRNLWLLTLPSVEGERGHQGYICANVSMLCVIRDVSTNAGSDQVTDQMRSDPLLNDIFSTFLVFLYSY